jgi:FkbM family methyltransferase
LPLKVSIFVKQSLNKLRAGLKNPLLGAITQKIIKNSYPGSFLYKFAPPPESYPKGSIRKVRRDNVKIELDLSDLVDWFLYWEFKDPGHVKLLNLIKKGQTIIDIGANKGHLSIKMSQKAGIEGKILAFEPNPITFQKLYKNLTSSTYKNIRAYNLGLGDSEGSFQLITPDEKNTGRDYLEASSSLTSEAIGVTVKTLDDVLSAEPPERVDLIKIDVEGFEEKVLKGAIETLKKYKPLLFIEIDDNNLKRQSSTAKSVIGFLEQLGYTSRHAVENTVVSQTFPFAKCHFDIVAKFEANL